MADSKLRQIQFLLALLFALVQTSLCDEMTNLNFQLEFNKTAFLGIEFDSAFYNVLFIENQTNTQQLKILDLDDMGTRTYTIQMASPLVFSGLLNTGNIVLVCQSHAYLASKLDGYSMVELTQISEFLRSNSKLVNASFNDFNQTVLAVYNSNKMLELDVRLPLQAKVNEFRFRTTEAFPPINVLDSVYISGGLNFAVLWENTTNQVETVHIYNQKSKAFVKRLSDQVDDTRRMVYNVELNLLLMVKMSSKTIIIMDCSTYQEIGVINFSLTGLDADKISRLHSPLGTKVLIIISGHKVFTFDLESRTFMREFVLPVNTEEVYWAESTQYFVSRHTKSETVYSFRFYKLETSDSRFCHKSCGSGCKLAFKPCYNTWGIALSMALAVLSLIVIGAMCYWSMVALVKTEKASEIMDEYGNVYELTDEGMRPKRNTISLEPGQLSIDVIESN